MSARTAARVFCSSRDENDIRHEGLAASLADLVRDHAPRARRGLDVGAQRGDLTRRLTKRTGVDFVGVELKSVPRPEDGEPALVRGSAHTLPFRDAHFDVAVFASLFEHLPPRWRTTSLREVRRVLRPGGVLVGQLPNMYFPVELHSRLPFQSYLPHRLGDWYFRRCSPVAWRALGTNWYTVGPGHLRRAARAAGFTAGRVAAMPYPLEALPRPVRRLAGLQRLLPLGYTFWFAAPA